MILWLGVAMAAPGTLLADGAVIDAERGRIYLAEPSGGISAVRIADGSLIWTSTSADFPLGSAGDLVIGWKDLGAERALRIVGLDDAGQGSLAVRCPDIRLPHWGRGSVQNSQGYENRVAARVRDGRIQVSWQITARYGRPPNDPMPLSQSHSGWGTCDPANSAWTGGIGTAAVDNADIPTKLEGKTGIGVQRGSTYVVAVLGPAGTVTSEVWDINNGVRLSKRDLGPAPPGAFPYPSLDGQAVAVVAPRPDGSAHTAIYDAGTGALITAFDATIAPFRWRMVGDVLVATGGDGVVGLGLDGTVHWTRAVRDRGFHGPYPE